MDYELYVGDCLDVLPGIDADSFEAVVTDPPYGGQINDVLDRWPSPDVWVELARVVKPDGFLAFTIVPHLAHLRLPDVLAAGWQVLEVGFWVYGSGRAVIRERLKRCYDLVYFCSLGERKLYVDQARGNYKSGSASGQSRRGSFRPVASMGRQFHPTKRRSVYHYGRDYHPANVACEPGCAAFEPSPYELIFAVKRVQGYQRMARGGHLTEKPVDLVAQMVKLVSRPGDVVLDPYAGSGTTGEACLRLGRRFVGIDVVERHVENTRRRLLDLANRVTVAWNDK